MDIDTGLQINRRRKRVPGSDRQTHRQTDYTQANRQTRKREFAHRLNAWSKMGGLSRDNPLLIDSNYGFFNFPYHSPLFESSSCRWASRTVYALLRNRRWIPPTSSFTSLVHSLIQYRAAAVGNCSQCIYDYDYFLRLHNVVKGRPLLRSDTLPSPSPTRSQLGLRCVGYSSFMPRNYRSQFLHNNWIWITLRGNYRRPYCFLIHPWKANRNPLVLSPGTLHRSEWRADTLVTALLWITPTDLIKTHRATLWLTVWAKSPSRNY